LLYSFDAEFEEAAFKGITGFESVVSCGLVYTAPGIFAFNAIEGATAFEFT
jgi:hypothetical protein